MLNSKLFLLENLEMCRESRKYLSTLDEEGMNSALDSAISRIYEFAVNKYNKIDLDNIPDSKGDITRFTGYKSMKEALENLDRCVQISGVTQFEDLETVKKALANLEKYKLEFSKAYVSNSYMVILIYNSMTYGVLAGINLVIAEWVEYSKSHGDKVIKYSKTDKSLNNDYMLIKSLKDFNDACAKGDFLKFISQVNKNKDKFVGVLTGATAVTLAIMVGAVLIIPIIRSIIYSVYDIRMSVAELLKNQSDFIKLNASNLAVTSNLSAMDRKRVEKKQLDAAKKLQSLSDKIIVKFDKADKNTKKELDKRLTVSDIKPSFSNTIGEDDNDNSDSGFLL